MAAHDTARHYDTPILQETQQPSPVSRCINVTPERWCVWRVAVWHELHQCYSDC
jgi:hypothetical protein